MELDFVDDYERPVLEKYEKVSPTPTVREKKEKEQTKVRKFTISILIVIKMVVDEVLKKIMYLK